MHIPTYQTIETRQYIERGRIARSQTAYRMLDGLIRPFRHCFTKRTRGDTGSDAGPASLA